MRGGRRAVPAAAGCCTAVLHSFELGRPRCPTTALCTCLARVYVPSILRVCRDVFWESTGLRGQSSLREVDLETGQVRWGSLLVC